MVKPIQGDQLGIDPLDRAVPGQSLTSSPKDWAWEKPPVYETPKEAIDTIVAKLNEESAYNQMMDMLYAGVSIESLVNTLTFVGFMNGLWRPDVAEGAKIPLFFWIMAQAAKSGLRPRLYNNLRKTDIDTNRIMKTMQPNEYKKTLAEAPEAPVEELPEEQPQEAVGEPFMTMEE